MLNGEIRSKIDALWNAFWTGGISNPLEVIEQITYLLFLKRLDDLHTLEENKAARLKLKKLERRVFPEGKDPRGRAYEDCRWSRFKHFEAKEMFEVVDQHVFRNPKVKARLTSKSRGIRQANISNGDVLELELPIPPISLQREFARRVTAVEAQLRHPPAPSASRGTLRPVTS